MLPECCPGYSYRAREGIKSPDRSTRCQGLTIALHRIYKTQQDIAVVCSIATAPQHYSKNPWRHRHNSLDLQTQYRDLKEPVEHSRCHLLKSLQHTVRYFVIDLIQSTQQQHFRFD